MTGFLTFISCTVALYEIAFDCPGKREKRCGILFIQSILMSYSKHAMCMQTHHMVSVVLAAELAFEDIKNESLCFQWSSLSSLLLFFRISIFFRNPWLFWSYCLLLNSGLCSFQKAICEVHFAVTIRSLFFNIMSPMQVTVRVLQRKDWLFFGLTTALTWRKYFFKPVLACVIRIIKIWATNLALVKSLPGTTK